MSGLYNISKVNAWLRGAARTPTTVSGKARLMYDVSAGLVTNGVIVLGVCEEMLPVLEDIYKHPNGGRILWDGRQDNETARLAELIREASDDSHGDLYDLTDTRLTLRLPAHMDKDIPRAAIYCTPDGQKVLLNERYLNLFQRPDGLWLQARGIAGHPWPVMARKDGRMVAAIMPINTDGLTYWLEFEYGSKRWM